MVKTSSQLQNMTEDWIKQTGVKYSDSTKQGQSYNPEIEWQFMIGNSITFSKLKGRDDRINIDSGAGISPQHQTAFASLSNKEINGFMLEVSQFAIDCGVKCNWEVEDEKITSFTIADYIDVEEFTRSNFMKSWDNVNNVSKLTIVKINQVLNPEEIVKPDASDSSDKVMYG